MLCYQVKRGNSTPLLLDRISCRRLCIPVSAYRRSVGETMFFKFTLPPVVLTFTGYHTVFRSKSFFLLLTAMVNLILLSDNGKTLCKAFSLSDDHFHEYKGIEPFTSGSTPVRISKSPLPNTYDLIILRTPGKHPPIMLTHFSR